MSDEFVDPYIDPETGVLRNLVGATSYDELANAEGELVSSRAAEFVSKFSPHVVGTLDDLKIIHHYLFQDIYDWAGEIRTVEIRKNEEGSQFFLPSVNIPMGIVWSLSELEKDDHLRGMGRDEFARRLAYHYDNYNFVHPFREGNGRTQRLFWTLVCHDAGYDLMWRSVSGEENDRASRDAAEERDYGGLIDMFLRIATPCDPKIPLNAGLVDARHLTG